MKKYGPILLALVSGLSLCLTPNARAWKVWQHQVIAEIAETHLRPAARQEVAKLLGPRHRMVDEAGWADYIRGYWWWTAPWHYINWPLELEEPGFDVYAAEKGNIVSAIADQLKIYRDRKKLRQDRLEALKFLIHFVGDIHQPLHCGTGVDKGANNVPVLVRGKPTNLHAAWDGTIYDDRGEAPDAHARRLLEGLKPEDRARMAGGTPYDWAVESHRIAREFAYPRLKDLAVRQPGRLPPELSGPYAEAAQPIMRRRLLEAGIRLAALLNETGETGPAAKAIKSTSTPLPPDGPRPAATPSPAGEKG